MKLNPVIESILKKIEFVSKYQTLSDKHIHESNEKMSNYCNTKVEETFISLGYTAKYMKKENFFKIVEKTNNVKFQFNISLKYGVCELIWAMWIDGNIQSLGPWSKIIRMIDLENPRIKPASFTSYDELSEILDDCLKTFDEFKSEVLLVLDDIK